MHQDVLFAGKPRKEHSLTVITKCKILTNKDLSIYTVECGKNYGFRIVRLKEYEVFNYLFSIKKNIPVIYLSYVF